MLVPVFNNVEFDSEFFNWMLVKLEDAYELGQECARDPWSEVTFEEAGREYEMWADALNVCFLLDGE